MDSASTAEKGESLRRIRRFEELSHRSPAAMPPKAVVVALAKAREEMRVWKAKAAAASASQASWRAKAAAAKRRGSEKAAAAEAAGKAAMQALRRRPAAAMKARMRRPAAAEVAPSDEDVRDEDEEAEEEEDFETDPTVNPASPPRRAGKAAAAPADKAKGGSVLGLRAPDGAAVPPPFLGGTQQGMREYNYFWNGSPKAANF